MADRDTREGATEPNGWTRLAELLRLENAMGVVLSGLKAGDNIATAWHEWPERRDLDEIEETLLRLDALIDEIEETLLRLDALKGVADRG